MQADNQPLPDGVEKALPLDSSQRQRLGSGAAILKFLKNNILKPRQPTEIHSTSIEGARDKTLAPFAMSGIEVGRVNRDYEAFFKTSAWGKDSSAHISAGANESSNNSGAVSSGNIPAPSSIQIEHSEQPIGQPSGRQERHTKQERLAKPSLPLPVSKPRSRTSGDVIDPREEKGKGAGLHSPQLPSRSFGANAPAKKPPILPPSNQGHPRNKQLAEVGFSLNSSFAFRDLGKVPFRTFKICYRLLKFTKMYKTLWN